MQLLPIRTTLLEQAEERPRESGRRAMDADSEYCVDVEHWTRLEDGRIECRVCPRFCKMRAGQRGLCFVRRAREDGEGMELTGYGRSTGFCVDPIEKKPLNHFLPGSAVLSFGTAGCNLACSFCQNHDISKSREVARLSAHAAPETIARAAERLGCASVAYTYNDPVIFMEYALDTAEACRARGVKNVAVTAGFVCDEPRKRLFAGMDAANVDLKAFTERFYAKRCVGSLEPVLETLKYLVHETDVWTEITTLLIPDENDSDEEIEALTQWVAKELKRDTPLHFTAFHPDYHMLETRRPRRRRCRKRVRSPSATGSLTSMSATSTTPRARRRCARPAARAPSGATAIRSPLTRSTPPAPAGIAGQGWPACSPPPPANGARGACRSTSSATRREASMVVSRTLMEDVFSCAIHV